MHLYVIIIKHGYNLSSFNFLLLTEKIFSGGANGKTCLNAAPCTLKRNGNGRCLLYSVSIALKIICDGHQVKSYTIIEYTYRLQWHNQKKFGGGKY